MSQKALAWCEEWNDEDGPQKEACGEVTAKMEEPKECLEAMRKVRSFCQ